jgi:hypothetical protein
MRSGRRISDDHACRRIFYLLVRSLPKAAQAFAGGMAAFRSEAQDRKPMSPTGQAHFAGDGCRSS